MVHCWEGYQDQFEEMSEEWLDAIIHERNGTCWLEHGHTGPHEFIPDDEIQISFKNREQI